MKSVANPNQDAEQALKFLLKVFELSRRSVVEPCQMLGMPEHRLLNQKRIKPVEMPVLDVWDFEGLDAQQRAALLNALDLIEMNAEMFHRLAKSLSRAIRQK
jgi:hypothetical protein